MKTVLNFFLLIALFISYFIMILPCGLLLKIIQVDFLNRKSNDKVKSYWKCLNDNK